MLVDLHIRNVAIIEEQSISFGPGLNVISGETGSGKSIILNALEFLLGGKPRASMLRAGADELEVQARFDLSAIGEGIQKDLPDIAQADELTLSRTLSGSGRGKVFINGKLGTLALLSEITSKLINICGQNQHIRLIDPAFHLALVDGFGGCDAIRTRYEGQYREWKKAAEDLRGRKERIERNAVRQAELEFIVEELRGAELEPGIRENLEAEVRRLGRAEGVIEKARGLVDAYSSTGGLEDQVNLLTAGLNELEKLDENVSEIAGHLRNAREQLENFQVELDRYAQSVEVDPAALEVLRERLAEVARLERKYRTSDSGLVELLHRSEQELAELGSESGLAELETRVSKLHQEVSLLGRELSEQRVKAGKRLAKEVERELGELNMKGAQLELRLESIPPGPSGCDKGEIYLSANRGEPPAELRRIASGGELSRIMLVLKKILKDRSGVNVLVFDEVDSGVSGSVARSVGQKLRQLSESSQVICITHLAQVASLADHHFLVGKKVGKRTVSLVRELSKQEQIEEIARMLAGYHITPAARESARELMASKD